MISVINKDFFTMRRNTVKDNDRYITLVNLYTDPKNAELHKYERKAFLSFIFYSNNNPENLSEDEVYGIMEKSDVLQNSLYVDDSHYDSIKDKFPQDIRYPSIIFEQTTEYTAKNLCLVAVPIKGIVSTIKKSSMYKLYNGSLIVCKIFKYSEKPESGQSDFYNKIIYILADINTTFQFNEFIQTHDDKFGIMNTYEYFLIPKYATNEIMEPIVEQKKVSSIVPYKDREDFFEPSDPNIFRLSDVPAGLGASLKKTPTIKNIKKTQQ